MQMFSELRGTTQTELHSPKFYIPEPLPIMANHEVQQLEEIAPIILQELDNISSHASTLHRTLDIDSLFHMPHIAQLQQNQLHWHSIIVTSISTTAILGVLYLCLHPYLHRFICPSPKPNDFIRPTLPTNTDLPQQAAKLNDEGSEQTTKFVSYPTQHAD